MLDNQTYDDIAKFYSTHKQFITSPKNIYDFSIEFQNNINHISAQIDLLEICERHGLEWHMALGLVLCLHNPNLETHPYHPPPCAGNFFVSNSPESKYEI